MGVGDVCFIKGIHQRVPVTSKLACEVSLKCQVGGFVMYQEVVGYVDATSKHLLFDM